MNANETPLERVEREMTRLSRPCLSVFWSGCKKARTVTAHPGPWAGLDASIKLLLLNGLV